MQHAKSRPSPEALLGEAIRLLPALRTHGWFEPALALADTCVALGHLARARQVLAQLTHWLSVSGSLSGL